MICNYEETTTEAWINSPLHLDVDIAQALLMAVT